MKLFAIKTISNFFKVSIMIRLIDQSKLV